MALIRYDWKKAFALATFLVACDPLVPNPGDCGNLPSCSRMGYGIEIWSSSSQGLISDSATGAYYINSLGFHLFVAIQDTVVIACPVSGRPGIAYATSCVSCTGKYLEVDSLYFTTDILLFSGDTLRAGYNFAKGSVPVGFSGGGSSLSLRKELPTRFRDSLFEVRFAGFADTVQKSGSVTLHITNPDLLIP